MQGEGNHAAIAVRAAFARAVEKALGPKPVHFYDICDQPEWVKRARQWAYEAKLPEPIYPIHCWSAGLGGDVRSPADVVRV